MSEERRKTLKERLKRVDVGIAFVLLIVEIIMAILFPWQAWLCVLLIILWASYIALRLGPEGLKQVGERFVSLLRSAVSRAPGYLKENPGAPFIIAFQAMLITCAIMMAQGGEEMANELAIYAFYSLVAGVILQFIAFLKYGGENEERHPSGSGDEGEEAK